MKRFFRLWPCALAVSGLVATAGAAMSAAPMADELKVGDPAPDFSLPGTDGKTYSLANFNDSPLLLVAFLSNHCPYSHAAETRLLPIIARKQCPKSRWSASNRSGAPASASSIATTTSSF